MACEVWLRRDYLLRHELEPDEPACDHNPEHCPPLDPALAEVVPIRPATEESADVPR